MYSPRILLSLINAVLGFVEILIGLRVLLKFFGANPYAPFVGWVYETSKPLLAPFAGMFPSPSLRGGFVIEFSALFALILYGFLATLVSEFLEQLHNNALEREAKRAQKTK